MVQSTRQRVRKLIGPVAASTALAVAMIGLAPGPAMADVGTFSNTTAIAVPAAGSLNGLGAASPYPSPITVSGLTGTVTDVNVTLSNLTHPIASDLDVLLVGPGGQSLVLMSDVKGDTGFPASGTIVFDDQAPAVIPATGALGTGTYQPTNRDDSNGPDTFPPPATAPSGATLGQFNGTNPNGVWKLYAVDDASGDVGTINGGWSITITTGAAAQPGVISFTTASFRGAEGGGPVALTLRRVGGSDGAVGVTVATTSPATATPGLDFIPLNQTVNFASGQVTASIPLTILNDTAIEGVDETLTVALSAPTGGATLDSPSSAVVRIDDNDATFDTTPITIPATGTGGSTGSAAAPYPASIHITGQPTSIGGVEVNLTGFTHPVPADVDILLVGPNGQNVTLMSDVGGSTAVSGVGLTFRDAASSTIPVAGPLTSGAFKPSDDDSGAADAFPPPAPAPSSATSLAGFVGMNPNGVWNLFVVDDASGDVGTINGGWSLTFLPLPPVADAGGPYTVAEGAPLALDGSGSSAPAGATYAWDLDGDGQFDDATGATPTSTAAQLATLSLGDGPAGPVTIGLRVTSGTQTSTDTTTLTVTNVAPTASAPNVPSGVVAGTSAAVTFAATDPSTADQAAGFAYAIDWGDGTPAQVVTGGLSVTAGHTWAASGSFTVSVTATDKDGGVSSAATASVGVSPLATADAGGPYTVAEGGSLSLDATGTIAAPTATYDWDVNGDGTFGDATGATPTLTAPQLAALGLDDGPSTSTITLKVTDGPSTATDTAMLTLTNVAPTASAPTVPSGIVAGAPTTVTFGATDPSVADSAAGFTYAIDWGDGGANQLVIGGGTVSVSHSWSAAGSFTVTVTATDKDAGTSAPATAPAVVAPHVVADAGGPYTVAEGDDLTLDASGTAAGPTAVYAWDLDGDGQFDDATGQSVSLTPEGLAALGLDDGPKGPVTLTLQVTEGAAVDTDTASYSITGVAPTATVDLPSSIVAGTPATFKVGAIDPSPTDAAAQFEYRIDWEGDGTVDLVVSGPADPPVTHTYASAGAVGLTVVAVDKDGAASAPTVTQVAVSPAATPTPTPTPSPLPPTGGDAAPFAWLAALAALLAAAGVIAALGGRRIRREHRG